MTSLFIHDLLGVSSTHLQCLLCYCFQLLLSFKAEIVVRRQSANGLYFTVDSLQLAAAYQHYDCLKALLAAGGQMVTLKSFTGVATSPYHTLVLQSCSWRYAELLYEFGFTAWVKDSRGRFPWETEPRGGGRDSASCRQLMEFFERVKGMPSLWFVSSSEIDLDTLVPAFWTRMKIMSVASQPTIEEEKKHWPFLRDCFNSYQ